MHFPHFLTNRSPGNNIEKLSHSKKISAVASHTLRRCVNEISISFIKPG